LTALAGLIQRLPEAEREDLLKVASVRRERVSVGTRPKVARDAPRDAEAEARLRAEMQALAVGEIRIAKRGSPDFTLFGPRPRVGLERLSGAIGVGEGKWLNAEFVWPQGSSMLPGLLLSAAVASLALVAVAVWLAYRFSGPLQRLSAASIEMARGK